MSPIELTDLHKFKLLEMCKVLFPNYYHLNFYSAQSKALQISETKNDLDLIHWFEFVMTYLVEKILNPNPNHPNRGLVDKFKDFFWQTNLFIMNSNEGTKHPIDYLYEQFKQLK